MGRPPLHVKAMKVRLAAEQATRIEALVGPKRVADFIRRAVEAELRRMEAEAATEPAEAKVGSTDG